MRPTTLKDIAAKTGLDVSTVSRVLNNNSALRIGAQKRAEVLQVARELHYVPHRSARSLRLQRHFNIGYVLSEVASRFSMLRGELEFPLTRVRIYGMEESLSTSGYLLSLLRLPTAGSGTIDEKALRRYPVDGLVYNCYPPSAEAIKHLLHAHVPAVLIDPFAPEELYRGKVSSVHVDRAYGVHCAMERLASRGHQQIALVNSRTNVLRFAGYCAAVRDLGLSDDPCLIKLFDPTIRNNASVRAEGCRLTQELLQEKMRFTAVMAGSDLTALGVIDALHAAGRTVPDDVAVMGYDDLEGYQSVLFSSPFLSTVRDPNFEMGRMAAQLLVTQIEEGAEPQHVSLQPELVLRQSA